MPAETEKPPTDRPTNGARPPALRSKISNDRTAVAGDQRSAKARIYRDTVEALISDKGGAELISEAEMLLIRRVGGLVVRLEGIEMDIVAGEPIDGEALTREINALVRVLNAIGLKRRARTVQPTLQEAFGGNDA